MFKFPRPLWQGAGEGAPAAPVVLAAPPAGEAQPPASLISGAAPAEPPVQPAAPEPDLSFAPLADLKDILPEGVTLDDARSTEVLAAINSGTRAEMAKNLLGLYQAEVTKFQTEASEVWNNTQTQWQNEITSAPEFKGEKLAPALAKANVVAMQLGGPEFVKMLDVTGMGNNIHALRALLKAADFIPMEGNPAGGRPSAQPKTLADKIFPQS